MTGTVEGTVRYGDQQDISEKGDVMARIAIVLVGSGIAALFWRAGGALGPEGLHMGIGLMFGILASIPAGILILAAIREEPDPRDIYYEPTPRRDRLRMESEQQGRITEKELRLTAEAAYWRGVAAGQQGQLQGRNGTQNRQQGQLPRRR